MVSYKVNLYENLTSSKNLIQKKQIKKYQVKNLRKEELNITKN